YVTLRTPPPSRPFPYTTLFRSRGGRQVAFLFLPEGDDPDSLVRREGVDAFRRRLEQAMPLSEFFFDSLSAEVDMTSIDGRARLRSEEHTSELQSRENLVCRLLL